MTKNNTVPTALANTADAELEAFHTYITSKEGEYRLGLAEVELDNLSSLLADGFGKGAENAPDVLGAIDGAIEHAESIVASLRDIREGYTDQLGIPAALEEVVEALQRKVMKPHVDALRYGLDAMWNSDRKLARDIREGLMALGMPKEYRGMASNSFRRASGDWTRQLYQAVAALPDHLKSERA